MIVSESTRSSAERKPKKKEWAAGSGKLEGGEGRKKTVSPGKRVKKKSRKHKERGWLEERQRGSAR